MKNNVEATKSESHNLSNSTVPDTTTQTKYKT